ncbi:hypothetical protein FG379_000523 [Cryptosporidium bovis]|uniref:uncharacterized protein n=1 Tax=Cryptosporidium bovis TaxID=310047 RepID=UPI00351A0089|nr:hypothetical protein FG379_000523 [Cryptosporidium bovis]
MSIIRPSENDQEIKNSLDSLIINDFIKPFNDLTDKVKELQAYSKEYCDEFDSRVDKLFTSLRKDELNIIKLEMRLKRIFELIKDGHGDKDDQITEKTRKKEKDEVSCKYVRDNKPDGGLDSARFNNNELRSLSSCMNSMDEVVVDPIIKSSLVLCDKRTDNKDGSEYENEISVRISTDGEVRSLLERYIKGADGKPGRTDKGENVSVKGRIAKGNMTIEDAKCEKEEKMVKIGVNEDGRKIVNDDTRVGVKEENTNEKVVVENISRENRIGIKKTIRGGMNEKSEKNNLVPKDINTKRRIKIDSVKRTLKLPSKRNQCGGLCCFLDNWCCCSFFSHGRRSGNYFKMSIEEWNEFLSSIEIKGDKNASYEVKAGSSYEIDGLPPLIVEYESLNVKNGYNVVSNANNNQINNSENTNMYGYYLNNGVNYCNLYKNGYNNGYNNDCNNQGYGVIYNYNYSQGDPGVIQQVGVQGVQNSLPISNSPSSYKGFRGKFRGKGKQMQEEIKQVQKVKIALENKSGKQTIN